MPAHVVDGEDVRVIQGGDGVGFLLEAAEVLKVGQLVGEDLDRHLTLEAWVAGAVDLSHPPRPEGRRIS